MKGVPGEQLWLYALISAHRSGCCNCQSHRTRHLIWTPAWAHCVMPPRRSGYQLRPGTSFNRSGGHVPGSEAVCNLFREVAADNRGPTDEGRKMRRLWQ